MDGFHLANQVLSTLGMTDRKGSPPTFDVGGFHSLLQRLRANTEDVIYGPEFFRDLEEPIAGALPVPRTVPLVIVEGNYLLLDDGPWQHTASFFDEIWYLCPEEATRQERLKQRHQSHGRTATDAQAWITHNDEPNARLVASTAHRADKIIIPAASAR
jgi:pantothenate kinase